MVTFQIPPGGGATFQEWVYPYTDEGNPLAQNDITGGQPNAHGEAYGYDMMHRLITWKRGVVDPQTSDVAAPAVGQAWELDSVGNWDDWIKSAAGQPDVVEQREHSNLHALTGRLIDQGQPTVLAYDDNGNQTDDGERFLFEYDANDLLRAVRDRATQQVVAEYRYDAFSRRVEKNVGGTVTRFYFSGSRIIEERDGDDEVTAFYTRVGDGPLTMDRNEERYFYHRNRLGSTYALTDSTGAVVERYAYEAYGKVTTYDAAYANPQSSSRVGNPWTYTGHFLDAESDLLHMLYRTYDPGQGRFKQTDLIGYVDGANLYQYVSSHPYNYVDTRGLAKTQVCECRGRYNMLGNARHIGDANFRVMLKCDSNGTLTYWDDTGWQDHYYRKADEHIVSQSEMLTVDESKVRIKYEARLRWEVVKASQVVKDIGEGVLTYGVVGGALGAPLGPKGVAVGAGVLGTVGGIVHGVSSVNSPTEEEGSQSIEWEISCHCKNGNGQMRHRLVNRNYLPKGNLAMRMQFEGWHDCRREEEP